MRRASTIDRRAWRPQIAAAPLERLARHYYREGRERAGPFFTFPRPARKMADVAAKIAELVAHRPA